MSAPELIEAPTERDRDAILAALVAYNDAAVGPTERHTVAVAIRDDGVIAGGLWGLTGYRWLFVQYLVVPARLRGMGHGRAIMAVAERRARELGCIGIWLDTFSFQARGFYEKLGFSCVGRIDDYPPGQQRFFMVKLISAD